MRKFNDREIEILKRLAKIDITTIPTIKDFLIKYFFKEKHNRALIIDFRNQWIYQYHTFQLNKKEINTEIFKFLEIISLLNYLEEARYVTIIKGQKESDIEMLYSKAHFNLLHQNGKLTLNSNGDYILIDDQPQLIFNKEKDIILEGTKIKDQFNFICNGIEGAIFPSEELIDLAKHNFKNKEDRKFYRQMWATWISIIIAFLLGVTGIYLSHFC